RNWGKTPVSAPLRWRVARIASPPHRPNRALTAPRPRSASEARCCPGRGAPLRPREPPSALLLKRGLTGPLSAQGPVLGVSDASACARVLALLGEALAAEILVPDAGALAARGRGAAGEEPE